MTSSPSATATYAAIPAPMAVRLTPKPPPVTHNLANGALLVLTTSQAKFDVLDSQNHQRSPRIRTIVRTLPTTMPTPLTSSAATTNDVTSSARMDSTPLHPTQPSARVPVTGNSPMALTPSDALATTTP